MNKRTIIFAIIMAIPFVALAQIDSEDLVKCGKIDANGVLASEDCDYTDLINLIQDGLNFIIYKLATPIAVVMFGWAGFKLIMNKGDKKELDDAKKVFTNVMWGYGIMLAAFLIVKLIFSFLFPDDYSLFN